MFAALFRASRWQVQWVTAPLDVPDSVNNLSLFRILNRIESKPTPQHWLKWHQVICRPFQLRNMRHFLGLAQYQRFPYSQKGPKCAQTVPKGCPKGAQTVLNGCPTGAQRVHKGYTKGAQRVPKGCPKGAQRVTKGWPKSAYKAPRMCHTVKGAWKVPKNPKRCLKSAWKVPINAQKVPENCP